MHYAKKMKADIYKLKKDNEVMFRAIWDAKTRVLGHEPGISPLSNLHGREESIPETRVVNLKNIILQLPLGGI